MLKAIFHLLNTIVQVVLLALALYHGIYDNLEASTHLLVLFIVLEHLRDKD